MKKPFVLSVIGLILAGCSNKEINSIQLPIQTFEMNKNCFSQQKLQQAEVLITNAVDYQQFEDSLRLNYFPSCNTTHFPAINFDSCFFVGKYTQASGCSVDYESKVFYQSDNSLYTYQITVISIGTCERLNTAFNFAVVPRQSEQINVLFQLDYRQQ